MNDATTYTHQLENIVQQSYDALEICALFEDKQSVFDDIQSVQELFSQTVDILRKRIPIQTHAYFVVDDDTKDMRLEYCQEAGEGNYVQEVFEHLVDNGYVAWALREKRLVSSLSKDGRYQVLLHSLTTRQNIHGLFLAFVSPNTFVINNINSLLFSVLLRSTAFAYENFLLYSRVEKQKKELSQTVDSLHVEMREKEEVEKNLRQSEVVYRNVFENTGNPTIIVNQEGKITLANSQFAAFSNYSQKELVDSKNIFDFLSVECLGFTFEALISCPSENRHQEKQEVLFFDRNRIKYHVLLYAYPLGIDDALIISLSDISKIKTVEKRLNFQAYHDQLTHLPNRAFLEERLEMAIRKAMISEEYSYAVVFIDIDRLKTINDTMGHAAGDQLIIAAGQKIRHCIRDVDTLARFGGDEFVLLLEGIKERRDCELVMQRLQAEFKKPVLVGGKEIYVTFSSGIFLASREYVESEEVIRRADIAMYQVKKKGRNKHEYYDQAHSGQEMQNLYLEQDLLRALSNDEIYLQYQPIVDLISNSLHSVEALARWNHPELGDIPPNQFIPIAESTNLIHPLGMKIFSLAFASFVKWQRAYPKMEQFNLAINMSVKQLMHQTVVEEIKVCAQQCGFPLERLHVEITESIFLDQSLENKRTIEELNRLGVTITIDDFGTGYSSLNYLNQFAIDAVKIDKSMIHQIVDNDNCQYIVESMVSLAQKMNLAIVAEGIEEREQLYVLQGLKCQLGQGFFFSRPISGELMSSFLGIDGDPSLSLLNSNIEVQNSKQSE
ncbi:MAG: EAL domain-containing protein [Thermodesulfobacteriota bacterium]